MDRDYEIWLKYAKMDLLSGEVAFKEGIFWDACFHAQQAVEKSLKSMVLKNGEDIPRTHKLDKLLGILNDHELLKLADDIVALDKYYMPIRYPDADTGFIMSEELTMDKAKKAMETATHAGM
jgi:HEPN domain-containing protein